MTFAFSSLFFFLLLWHNFKAFNTYNLLLKMYGLCTPRQAGTIQSPNYPFFYPPSMECVWRLSAPGPASLRLDFQTLDLHPSDLIEVRYADPWYHGPCPCLVSWPLVPWTSLRSCSVTSRTIDLVEVRYANPWYGTSSWSGTLTPGTERCQC